MSPRTCGRLLLGALLLGGAWIAWSVNTVAGLPHPAPVEPGAAPARTFAYKGAASCSSSSCHGDTDSRNIARCAATIWAGHDKHVRAYEVLLTDRSKIIEKNYRQLTDLKQAKAEADLLCLKCHSTDAEAAVKYANDPAARLTLGYAVEDGVGCEACHGRASAWLADHYLRTFKSMSPRDKKRLFDYNDTKDLVATAEACLKCHVGTVDQEVNHDLMAAGHPRLNFELSAYMTILPPHWDVRAEKRRIPGLEARAWAVGKVVAAQKAAELTAARAKDEKAPWPEFTEYDCFACHHDFQQPGWRHKVGFAGRAPGAFPWATWYLPMLPQALEYGGAEAKLPASLEELRKEMEKPLPSREKVATLAAEAAKDLGERGAVLNRSKGQDPSGLANLFGGIAANPQLPGNWDTAVHTCLALVSLHQARSDMEPSARNAGVRKTLQGMLKDLSYPRGLDSPYNFTPEKFERDLQQLRK